MLVGLKITVVSVKNENSDMTCYLITCIYFMTYSLGPISTIMYAVLQLPIISLQPSVMSRFSAMFTEPWQLWADMFASQTPHHGSWNKYVFTTLSVVTVLFYTRIIYYRQCCIILVMLVYVTCINVIHDS